MKQVKLSVRDVNAIAESRVFWKYVGIMRWLFVAFVGSVLVFMAFLAIGADEPVDKIYEPLFDEPEGINLVITGDMRIAEYGNYHW